MKAITACGGDLSYPVLKACADDLLSTVLDGCNATVLAYGQTGAGKTYTMTGGKADYKQRGLIPRSIHKVIHCGDTSFLLLLHNMAVVLENICSASQCIHGTSLSMPHNILPDGFSKPVSIGICRLEGTPAVNLHCACQLPGNIQ